MRNKVQLITYVDRLGGGDLRDLHDVLSGALEGLFGGVHVLPFFDPIDGADTGFDPIDHLRVDSRLGNWDDVTALSASVEVTADLIVNHISAQSSQFRDYLEYGEQSEYSGMFLTVEHVFPDGPEDEGLARVYRPRPTAPYVTRTLADGTQNNFWTTFTDNQIDMDVHDPQATRYLKDILGRLAANGVKLVRLDAVGYAVKTPGTSCFMTPETYAFIDEITAWARELDMEVLAEIHTHYSHQQQAARHVDYVYDFALPPLVLHSLFENDARALKNWFDIGPRNTVTVLDTHDGIGVMDVGPDWTDRDKAGLIEPEYIDSMVEKIHENSGGVSRTASRHDVGNLDLYQVNCTYYDALGRHDRDYLLARLIQFFAPGIPQVYYVGLLAGRNDEALLGETGSGRDVNRAFYSREDIDTELQRPVVRSLLDLIRFRNDHAAFCGTFERLESPDSVLHIRREDSDEWAELVIDFGTRQFQVTFTTEDGTSTFNDFSELQ